MTTPATPPEAVASCCPWLSRERTEETADHLRSYAEALVKFAPHTNLVSVSDLDQLPGLHLIPALSMSQEIALHAHSRILDVGSGAGLPAIPLALVLPAGHFTLVEARRRRCNFLRHCVRTLALGNVKVLNTRVEDLEQGTFDIIMSRAVGGLRQLREAAALHLRPHGLYLTTQGPKTAGYAADHRAQTSPHGVPSTVVSLHRASCG